MRRISALVLVIAILLSICGCRTSDHPYIPTGNGLAGNASTKPTDSAITDRELSLPYYPDRSLNPCTCTDYVNRALLNLVYQGLFAVRSDYEVRPILCKNYRLSRDMKTYTFYLESATFSDGSVLTASDVVASLKQAKDSGFYAGRFSNVKSIAEADDGAVQIVLTTPYENFPILLDVPIVKASQLTAARPLGTGPYQYEEADANLWLHRRSDWWCRATTPVTSEYINLTAAEGPAQLVDAFERAGSGLGMVVADPGSVSYADFHGDSELWDSETGVFLYLGCNANSQVFSNDAVRQALTYAIDRAGLAEQFYRGFATPTVLPVSPKSPVYAPGLASKVTYDPGKLTQAVSDAGLTDAPVTLLVNASDGIRLRAARALANALSQCGLKVTTSEQSDTNYRSQLRNGKFDLYLGQTKLSANMDLSAFFASKGSLSYGSMNDPVLYALCQDSLANAGNYYTLYQKILADGQLCPVLMRSHAVYARRGAMSALTPSRDCIFYYDLGKTMEQILLPE